MHYKRTNMQRKRATEGPFTFRLDEATRTQLQKLAIKHRVKMGLLVRQALKERLPEWKEKGVLLG